MERVTIDMRGKPKPRPRSTKGGHVYLPADYMEWREQLVWEMKAAGLDRIDGPAHLELVFDTDTITVVLRPLEKKRPTHVRADLDNLAGGVMEALEDGGFIANDRDILDLEISVAPRQHP